MYAPAIHFYTFDPSSALDVTDAGVPCVAWTLCAGVPSVIETLGGTGTWSACHEPGTGWDWARSARVPSDTGTRVLGKSVTLQVPFWHCVHHGHLGVHEREVTQRISSGSRGLGQVRG
jgi:hypothetical protein